jgi:hexosaminidase
MPDLSLGNLTTLIKTFFRSAAFVAFVTMSAFAQTQRPALIPEPREFQSRENLSLVHGVSISAPAKDEDDSFAAKDLLASLKELGIVQSAKGTRIYLLRDNSPAGKRALAEEKLSLEQPMLDEGYVLFTSKNGLYVVAHTAEGLFYGAQSVKQLVSGSGASAAFRRCGIVACMMICRAVRCRHLSTRRNRFGPLRRSN